MGSAVTQQYRPHGRRAPHCGTAHRSDALSGPVRAQSSLSPALARASCRSAAAPSRRSWRRRRGCGGQSDGLLAVRFASSRFTGLNARHPSESEGITLKGRRGRVCSVRYQARPPGLACRWHAGLVGSSDFWVHVVAFCCLDELYMAAARSSPTSDPTKK